MAAVSTATGDKFLKLYGQATNWTSIADNTASTPATNIYLALHTASPGAGGNQTTNEIAYTSYARVAVARSSSGFDESALALTLHSLTSFPAGTGGSGTAANYSYGLSSSGTGTLDFFGGISPSVVTGSGVTPQLTTATSLSIS